MKTSSFSGDFNVDIEEILMKNFCNNYHLSNLIKQPTCYKNPEKLTCIDFILTNVPQRFQGSCAIGTGLSDFHRMILTVRKTSFKMLESKIISYRNYKNFSNESFRKSLLLKLAQNSNSTNEFK